MRFARFPFSGIFTAGMLIFSLSACETQAPYAACGLDKEVTDKGICTGTSSNTSCVVKKHPQCDQAVCLSYYSMPAICTIPCSTDGECGDGFCWSFAPGDPATGKGQEKYCVSNATKAAKLAADKKASGG